MRFLPRSASSIFLMSQLIAAVDILFPFLFSFFASLLGFVARGKREKNYRLMNSKCLSSNSIFAEYPSLGNWSVCQILFHHPALGLRWYWTSDTSQSSTMYAEIGVVKHTSP